MALRVGAGDVFTLCRTTLDLCTRNLCEEHIEAHTITAEMKLMRTHLSSLESRIGDERSFATARPDIAPIIKRFLEPLHRDLKDIHHHINHNNTRKPSIHVVDQVRYLVVYKAKLDGFRAKLPTHRASISAMHDLMEFQTPSARRESIVKLEELVGELEARQDADDSTETTHPELAKGEEFTIGSRLSKCT